ncbi:hypothetical protein ILUMI_03554 [Ignelater luminosus]|uniref:Peptidase S1 domain-containing protein n=1 Tax=Ignelater luminosus TaxID=2038154 RepID=A0A8K0DGC8_IGNLU|nr:hypothetical protein ILUMI_03554 [Ignelater luminosus]
MSYFKTYYRFLKMYRLLMLRYSYLLLANQLGANWRPTYERADQQHYGVPGFCPSNTQCLPLSSCPVLSNIVNHACVYSNRVTSLGCGYEGSGLVCCPRVSEGPPVVNQMGEKCGSSSVQGPNYNGLGAFPFVARIGFRNVVTGEMKYPCSGSIISNRIILTAAHCALAKSDNYKLFTARVGEYLTDSRIDCGEEFCALPVQDITISHVILHPGYQKEIYKDNIALLVLNSKINYTVTAQPICLPESWSVTGNYGTLVGWGKMAGQIEAPTYQQVLQFPIVGLQQCVNIYGRTLPITEYQLCAGGEHGKDACTGFGGSPLLQSEGDTYYQVGILSFGSDQCGAPGIPSVYTNVKKYVNWIKENSPVLYNNQ